ncbi:glycoprotein-N-acetylgalactosamine 3-beta-galactosyltransferase 1-like [Panulirus ornatus]|uniref:glycoprotein-N-acetylgalactosamine 3-beta-galactosyltransferase 1-like n=1 Tax=Panulirus ornatus TaxID=150431 RepID=UPI003A85ED7E
MAVSDKMTSTLAGLNMKTILLMMISMMMGSIFSMLLLTSVRETYIRHPMSHEDLKGEEIPDEPLTNHNPDELHHKGENIEAARLAEKVRVLCWIMTRPETHLKKAQCVKATWGSRCNKLIFMSSQNDSTLGAVDLGLGEGRNVLWGKTKAAFKYAYDHHLNDYDWFYKADDDTYTIMENMRYMLSRYDPEFPSYFGSRFNKFHKLGYMSGATSVPDRDPFMSRQGSSI